MASKDFSKELSELFSSDDGSLFKPKDKPRAITGDDRLIESFEQVYDFIEKEDRLPQQDAEDFNEARLAKRLESIKYSPEKSSAVKHIDSRGILDIKTPDSIEELFSDSDSLFSPAGSSILDVKHVPVKSTLSSPLSVERRKQAKDFDSFKPGFEATQTGLSSGDLTLIRFKEMKQLKAGNYYVMMGQMLYVESIGEKQNVHGRNKARTRCIFENGAESAMYDQSLAHDLYKDGYVVKSKESLLIDPDDIANKKGSIYILRSLSDKPEISSIKDLYKIGFSKNATLHRIKDAENDPTYLMSQVEVVESYGLVGEYNPQKVEHMIHRVFADAAVDLKIIDGAGKEYRPLEWYSVPIEAIREAVDLISSGEIVNYVYDSKEQTMKENDAGR